MTCSTPFPENLLRDIAGEQWQYALPHDINATISYIAARMPETEQKIFDIRYIQRTPRSKIAQTLNLTEDQIRNIENKILRHFRHPNVQKLLRTGIECRIKNTMTPAMYQKQKTLTDKIQFAANTIDLAAKQLKEITGQSEKEIADSKQTMLNDPQLCLPPRIINALKRAGIETLEQLVLTDEHTIRQIRDIGDAAVIAITKLINEYAPYVK